MFLLYAQWEHFDHMARFEEHCNYMSKTEQHLEQISNDCQLLWVVTYEAHVEVTIQTPQKCSHQSQIEHMLWVHFKCVLYVITMKSLGSFNQSSQCSQYVITGFRPPHPQCLQPIRSHQLMVTISGTTTTTYHHLNISHGMVQTSTDHTDQLPTRVDSLCPCSLVVTLVPLLHVPLHLSSVVGSEGETLEMMTSSEGPRSDKVLQ